MVGCVPWRVHSSRAGARSYAPFVVPRQGRPAPARPRRPIDGFAPRAGSHVDEPWVVSVRAAFLEALSGMFLNYRSHLSVAESDPTVAEFDRTAFLRGSPPEYRRFLTPMLDTQVCVWCVCVCVCVRARAHARRRLWFGRVGGHALTAAAAPAAYAGQAFTSFTDDVVRTGSALPPQFDDTTFGAALTAGAVRDLVLGVPGTPMEADVAEIRCVSVCSCLSAGACLPACLCA